MTVLVHKPAAPDPAPLGEGARIAPGYEVIEHLSHSKLLDVYDVWSEERDCRCVAKMLAPGLTPAAARTAAPDRRGTVAPAARPTHTSCARTRRSSCRGALVILETLGGATLWHVICSRSRRLPLDGHPVPRPPPVLGRRLPPPQRHPPPRSQAGQRDIRPRQAQADRPEPGKPPGGSSPGAGTAHYIAPSRCAAAPGRRHGRVGNRRRPVRGRRRPCARSTPIPSRAATRSWSGGRSRSSKHRRGPTAFTDTIAACLEPDAERRPTVARQASSASTSC